MKKALTILTVIVVMFGIIGGGVANPEDEPNVPVPQEIGGTEEMDMMTLSQAVALAQKVNASLVKDSVSDWLDDHPEATTTVEDGAITKAKLDENLKGTVDDFNAVVATRLMTDFAAGYYNLANAQTSVDFLNPTASDERLCGFFSCSGGDKFTITGRGSSGAKLFAWCKDNGDIISRSDNQTQTDATITAPANASFLVVNFIKAYEYSLKYHKSVVVFNELTDLLNTTGALMHGTADADTVSVYAIENGKIWNTTTGKRINGSGWISSSTLIPYTAEKDTCFLSTCGYNVAMACYDRQKNFIKNARAGILGAGGSSCIAVPAGTCYLGLNVHNTSVTKISMKRIPYLDVLETPYSMAPYTASLITDGSGVLSSSDSYGCVAFAVNPGEKYYTNETLLNNFVCIKKDGTAIGAAEYTERTTHGRVYIIPENAVYCLFNVQYNKTHGTGYYSGVAHRITKSEKILCIGDSITFLDGQTSTSYDNASLFVGWQKRLTRAGYDVESAGYSGYPYAVLEGHGSIYTEIVTNEFDVSGYDIIILLGGTNDDYYGANVGETPNTYTNPTYDTTTMLGALGGIIKYIREQNTGAKIILCTMLKSESSSRPYAEAKTYVEGIKAMAEYASCHLLNTFQEMNIQPGTDGFDLNFYDTTHPNRAGMVRLGNLVLKAVETVREQ